MRKVSLFVGALYSVFSVMAQRYETIVAPLNDEKWWGGLDALGSRMPFASTTEWYDLGKVNLNNQIVPLLLSSEGRYVWSEQPLVVKGTHRKVKLPKGVWRDDMGKKSEDRKL